MVDLLSERRMVENEAVFRGLNEQVNQKFLDVQTIAKEDGQESFIPKDSLKLHFYCECADENCTTRIVISLKEYRNIHKQRDHFIVLPGHEVLDIERVTRRTPTHYVVEKLLNPPEYAKSLHVTNVDNS